MSEDLPFSPDGPISRDGSSESEALSVDTQEEKACADWIQMQDCVKNRNTETFKQQVGPVRKKSRGTEIFQEGEEKVNC